jgi:uncharacterized protein (DUF58 family)
MLTGRAWWLLLTVLALLTWGVLGQVVASRSRGLVLMATPNTPLVLVALTVGLWFLWQWLLFVVRIRALTGKLRVDRVLSDDHGPTATLWAGRAVQVQVTLRSSAPFGLPYVVATDRVPLDAVAEPGAGRAEGRLSETEPLELRYRIHCPTAGRIRFEGVAVQVADLQGFFYHATVLRGPAVFRVLPPLADAEGHAAKLKRHNLLPPPGIHRLRQPGSGSELLDLRDYLPGDPPKTIAWKVSARRDRLITKIFESEVPVRCTLFVDTSNSVRVGPPGKNALARLVEIGATVAQAAAANRDLVGLCLFDERAAQIVRPARGGRHLVHLLNTLTDAAGLAPTTGRARLGRLVPLAYAFVDEVYPELLARDLNTMPFWLSYLWPVPTYSRRRPSVARRAAFWVLWLVLLAVPLGCAGIAYFLVGPLLDLLGAEVGIAGAYVFVMLAAALHLPYWLQMPVAAVLGVCVLLGAGSLVYGVLAFVSRAVPQLLSKKRRRAAVQHKRLAAVLSVHYGLAPGGLARFLEDEEQFGLYIQRFLAEHHVPYALPLYDEHGRYLFAAPGKIEVLSQALLGAVGKGHDNELFVLLADLLELTGDLDPLLRAIKVALARHHQVVVICPWPPDMPLPTRTTRASAG